tara:strand:+ start:2418 stop:4058 length:1641 start_codon:yes stop_codon:yes gene_type:complete
MTGGLMNLTAQGNENIILNGNPKKTFFKATYNKHTNFGLQKFRIDFEGNRVLDYNSPTVLDFKIPRYADMLHDTYICINLPDIYSPIKYLDTPVDGNQLVPYEFKWIQEIGAYMIREIEIHSGGVCLSRYTGEYLSCLKERDYTKEKKELWNKMTGNIPELHSPEYSNGRVNIYPNSQFLNDSGVEPSIRGRKLYIPLDAFFCDSSKLAIPLVAIQYQEISIKITFEATKNLYTINNVNDVQFSSGISYRAAPNPNIEEHQLWRFIQPPADIKASTTLYNKTKNDWNSDIHLISTYVFLDKEEQRIMAQNSHNILMKQIYTYTFLDMAGSKIVDVESKDLVANWMWRFRRSDAFQRNEWNNYTNWAYKDIQPQKNMLLTQDIINKGGPYTNANTLYITGALGNYSKNVKDILIDMGIIMEGVYRENMMDSGVYNYIEKYNKTAGNTKDGIYFYSFGTNGIRKEYQPSGAMNVNRFSKISFEFNTIQPPLDPTGSLSEYICDLSGNPIGFRKNVAKLNTYTYDLAIFEERYNVIMIQSGRIGLLHAR